MNVIRAEELRDTTRRKISETIGIASRPEDLVGKKGTLKTYDVTINNRTVLHGQAISLHGHKCATTVDILR